MRRVRIALGALLMVATAAPATTVTEERQALDAARRERSAATRRADAYDRAAAAATDDADRARRAQAAIGARIQAAEADIAAARARIALIERLRASERARLAVVQAPVVRMGAALQTLARRPPALALVQPGSIDDLVHVRALLAAAVPAVRRRSTGVRAELAQAARLRGAATQAARALADGRDRLASERGALARTEAEHRTRSARLVDSAMGEQDRALAMGEQARDITTRIDDLGRQASVRARLASLPGPIPRPSVPGLSQAQPPVLPGLDRLPPWHLPVAGRVTTGVGELSAAGTRARGLTLTPMAGARVVAPAAGRIAYAAPFRGYGRIVIVDHGGGWTTLLTGLARVSVATGDRVMQGSPIGIAASRDPAIVVELRHHGRAVDIASLVVRG